MWSILCHSHKYSIYTTTSEIMVSVELRLLHPPQVPPVFTATAHSLLSDAERIISSSRELHDSLVKNMPLCSATFSDVLIPLGQAENALIRQSRMLVFYQSVSPDATVREASAKAKNLFDSFKIEVAMNELLFGSD